MSDVATKPKEILSQNLWKSNPIFMQVLGICSALAVTNLVANTLIMSLGVMFVTAFSSLTISSIKDLIPRRVRMIVQVLVIAFFTIIVDIILKAYSPAIHRNLGPYVGLIITNCIIMGRAEAFAQSNKPFISFFDGMTSAAGYMGVLLAISIIRETLGFGTLLGFQILPLNFTPWIIMVMPPSAFFLIGLIIWGGKTALQRQGEVIE